MIIDRYYFHQLSKTEQVVYKAIYNGVKAHQNIIPLHVKGELPEKSLEKIFFAVTNDNPLIYYLNQSVYSYATDQFGHIALCPQYFWGSTKVREYNKKIEKEIIELINQLQLFECSDYEKEKKIHDWMCLNISYDYDGSDVNNPLRVIESHNVIGVFARRKAQCEGIAKAVKVLLNALDMKCIVVTGEATSKETTELHAWNIVKINNVPYQLDVTWDIGHKIAGRDITYDYFNINDQIINRTHKAYGDMPKCDSLDANFFTINNLTFGSERTLYKYIQKSINQGNKEFYFRLEDREKASSIINEVKEYMLNLIYDKGKQTIRIHQITDDYTGTCWLMIE